MVVDGKLMGHEWWNAAGSQHYQIDVGCIGMEQNAGCIGTIHDGIMMGSNFLSRIQDVPECYCTECCWMCLNVGGCTQIGFIEWARM